MFVNKAIHCPRLLLRLLLNIVIVMIQMCDLSVAIILSRYIQSSKALPCILPCMVVGCVLTEQTFFSVFGIMRDNVLHYKDTILERLLRIF